MEIICTFTTLFLNYVFSGTVIKRFNATDTDPGDSIRISISDPTTNDYVTFNQTQGSFVQVWVILHRLLDRDRVCFNYLKI